MSKRLQKIRAKWDNTRLLGLKGIPKDIIPEVVFDAVVSADPTPNHKYVDWCLDAWNRGTFQWEDIRGGSDSIVADQLLRFETNKHKLPDPTMRSLLKYSGPGDLDASINAIGISLGESHLDETGKQRKKALMAKARLESIHHETETGLKFDIPLSRFASCILGRNTRWCTAAENDNAFSDYAEVGPLTIITLPTGERYQAHCDYDYVLVEDGDENNEFQILDELDRRLTQETLDKITPYKKEITTYLKSLYMQHYKARLENNKSVDLPSLEEIDTILDRRIENQFIVRTKIKKSVIKDMLEFQTKEGRCESINLLDDGTLHIDRKGNEKWSFVIHTLIEIKWSVRRYINEVKIDDKNISELVDTIYNSSGEDRIELNSLMHINQYFHRAFTINNKEAQRFILHQYNKDIHEIEETVEEARKHSNITISECLLNLFPDDDIKVLVDYYRGLLEEGHDISSKSNIPNILSRKMDNIEYFFEALGEQDSPIANKIKLIHQYVLNDKSLLIFFEPRDKMKQSIKSYIKKVMTPGIWADISDKPVDSKNYIYKSAFYFYQYRGIGIEFHTDKEINKICIDALNDKDSDLHSIYYFLTSKNIRLSHQEVSKIAHEIKLDLSAMGVIPLFETGEFLGNENPINILGLPLSEEKKSLVKTSIILGCLSYEETITLNENPDILKLLQSTLNRIQGYKNYYETERMKSIDFNNPITYTGDALWRTKGHIEHIEKIIKIAIGDYMVKSVVASPEIT